MRYAPRVVTLLRRGPRRGAPLVALAHGAGAPMDSPFMEAIAEGLASRGVATARFEFPYMERARARGRRGGPDRPERLRERWLEVAAALGGGARIVVGGKSLGGRVASLVADEVGARGLVCLGYPFRPPGRPERLRTAHLADLATPALIVQGTRDRFGTPDEVAGYRLSPSIRLHWIDDGDHDLKPRVRSGRTHEQALAEAVDAVAGFVGSLG